MTGGLTGRLRNAMRALRADTATAPPATSVGETTPCVPRRSDRAGRRLNLLLPSINAAHYFGGIHTAVTLYREMCAHFAQSRIILLDSAPEEGALARFSDHALVSAEQDPAAARQVVPFNDRYGRTLPVTRGDVWLATAWWTAHAAQRMAHWQESQYGGEGPLAYLIQDFEPGFYPWSSQSALALDTYRPVRDMAVFNTSLLADYFRLQGIDYRRAWTFEPNLHAGLRDALVRARVSTAPRERRIVVYGRPSTPRNGFELICEGLRQWGWSDPSAADWDIVAPGELTSDVDLGPVRIRALGKLDIQRYAELLATSSIGISLMVSPHPSYPPLEMASFGMRVLTNRYANKALEQFSSNISSIAGFSPEAISSALADACATALRQGMAPLPRFENEHTFLRDSGLAAIGSELSRALLSTNVTERTAP
jgi:hypothetical protein